MLEITGSAPDSYPTWLHFFFEHDLPSFLWLIASDCMINTGKHYACYAAHILASCEPSEYV